MIIAAHIYAASTSASVLYNSFLLIAQQQPKVKFIFLVDKSLKEQMSVPSNIEVLPIKFPKNRFMLGYWYTVQLPALLKKHKVTHFISENGLLGKSITIHQFALINNISFLQKKPIVPQEFGSSIKKQFPTLVQNATVIFVKENFIANTLHTTYPPSAEKTKLVKHGLSAVFRPTDWEEKDKFLATFSQGTEYFIAECTVLTRQNILSLLKAFSLFKKRQKSGMKLVLVLKALSIDECVRDFHLYKYRNDVILVSYTNDADYAKMLAAAYAAIYLPVQIIAENSGLNALASGTALVTFKNDAAENTYNQAALYADLSEQSIAEQMMLLYKDEALRKSIIEQGMQLSCTYNWPATAQELWQGINS